MPDFPYSAIRPITIADKNNDRIRRLREGGLSTFPNQAGDSDPHSIDFGAVLQTKTVQPRAPASGVKTIIAVIFLACAAALVSLHFSSALKGTDFPDFYCAARILLDGHAHNLYDAAFQYRYQAEYAGRVGTLYIHPPYEAALYLSVAWLPLRYAYMVWSFLNLLLLAFAARVLARTTLLDWDWQLLPIFALTFVPVLLCLIQGQDSIVLLLLVVLAYANLRRGRNLTSGCWLALGLFKFQLVLPIAIVLLLARSGIGKQAFASGFATVMLALMGLSAAISGWSVFTVYPKFLLHLPAQQFAGIIPQVMPNFRGMVFTVFHHNQSWWSGRYCVCSFRGCSALQPQCLETCRVRIRSAENRSPRHIRSRIFQHCDFCAAGQLSSQPARPYASAVAHFFDSLPNIHEAKLENLWQGRSSDFYPMASS